MFSSPLLHPSFTFREFQCKTFAGFHNFLQTILKCLGIRDYASRFLYWRCLTAYSQLSLNHHFWLVSFQFDLCFNFHFNVHNFLCGVPRRLFSWTWKPCGYWSGSPAGHVPSSRVSSHVCHTGHLSSIFIHFCDLSTSITNCSNFTQENISLKKVSCWRKRWLLLSLTSHYSEQCLAQSKHWCACPVNEWRRGETVARTWCGTRLQLYRFSAL